MEKTPNVQLTLVNASEWQQTYLKDLINALVGNDGNSDMSKLDTAITDMRTSQAAHADNQENPHGVTKEQLGLGSVDNTADLDKPISTATKVALDAITKQIGDVASVLDALNGEVV